MLARVDPASTAATVNGRAYKSVMIRPLATLSGPFDAGSVASVRIDFLPWALPFVRAPNAGDTVLVILVRHYSSVANGFVFKVLGYSAPYMPNPLSPIAVVSGVSDPKIARTLSQIRQLRADPPVNRAGRGVLARPQRGRRDRRVA